MSHWFVYLIVTLNSINFFFVLVAWALFIVTCVLLVVMLIGILTKDVNDRVGGLTKCAAALFFIFGLVATFMPNTKQAAVIYLLPAIANSETAHELEGVPKNLAKLLNEKTEQWVNETLGLKKEKKSTK